MPAGLAVGRTAGIAEPRLEGGRLFWLEQRPGERGRTTLMGRGGAGAAAVDLTPGTWNLRTRVHEYGGGAYAVAGDQVVFVDDGDRCLWQVTLTSDGDPTTVAEPRRLTAPPDPERPRAFADGLIDRGRRRWIGVMEQDGLDRLVAVPLAGGEPELLHQPADFCGYAVLAPGGGHLAWVSWEQPFMPWERSQLWLAAIDAAGQLRQARPIAGSAAGDPQGISVFQPLWLDDGSLVVANDRSGWWNLERLADASALGPDTPPRWQPLCPMEAEFATPQWVYGLRTTAWDGERLLAAACRQGRWELGRLALDGGPWEPIPLPFSDLAALSAAAGRLVAVAAAPAIGQGLLELDTASGTWQHTPAAPAPLAAEAISLPEPLWFDGHGGTPTHAWYYPPRGSSRAEAPLLVKGHSGPTAMAGTGLNLAIQFWTSRGWGVVDVNYGGSTGFGRAYRERLDGQWGVVDVADCAAAARAVVAAGKADPTRVAFEGGSAGGFTVLAALCFTDVFTAGAVRYPVTDPEALLAVEHRFEARYTETLIGPWPGARALYEARSPLRHAARITAPVLFFHGLDDRVVPARQSEQMVDALRQRGQEVELHLIPGEGHGFRDSAVRTAVLEATEAFFRRRFHL
ncbi:dipeptidyl aminopeptidase/acylaminoacyl peptidase [Cyanobium sp. Copco_Reservoir_LC18]|uniref:alpha/beta hydrolase family protein n=1 Tax=Cyanobium sp. Copco_Reservoir_LC18 TaxID=1328305 RepID=UPI00135BFA8E|nr:prolyl oligopeptidase family serine peptidase [Cyanobium sp. Copco_Reservoir_LC18]KAF0654499.1 dipeptidyl aminopeptidase/acylaminoacyl peptidase [Cyanobium sp. Copco_Reservoir_LC18]